MRGVELYYDPGCPSVEEARTQLLRAFALAGMSPHWIERVQTPEPASAVLRYASPSILINGRDVHPNSPPGQAPCCRLYRGPAGRLQNVPTVEAIAVALCSASRCAQ